MEEGKSLTISERPNAPPLPGTVIHQKGFIVADAFTMDLEELWERKKAAATVGKPPVVDG